MKKPPGDELDPATRIGHVNLTVSDLERSTSFYRDILGFTVQATLRGVIVFLASGSYHHHIALNTLSGNGATPPPEGHTGLYHFAVLYPSRLHLKAALRRLIDYDWPIEGISDHGVSIGIYLKDPDGIGVELMIDVPEEEWRRNEDGTADLSTRSMTVEEFLT